MITQTPWIERQFNFEFPAGIYPCLLERMAGTSIRIEEMVREIPREILSRRIEGRWSIMDHIGHLYDLEELNEIRLREFIENVPILSAADMSNKKTEDAHHHQKTVTSLLSEFRHARIQFVNELRQADENLIGQRAIHPRLKISMRLVDFIYFVCEHDDHHLAKMRSIIQ